MTKDPHSPLQIALIEAIDPNWQGALPYTLVVEPGGKIVYAKQGTIDPDAMKTLLIENTTLANSLRKIVQKSGGFDANFLGLTQKEADLACRRLQARGVQCFTMGS